MIDKQKDAHKWGRLLRLTFFARWVAVALVGTVMFVGSERAAAEEILPESMFVEGKIAEGKLKDYLENLKKEAKEALSDAKKATVDGDVAMAEAKKARMEWERAMARVKKALAEGKLVLAEEQDRATIIEMLERHFKK